MKHCVIALNFQNNYISVLCHYDEIMEIGRILNSSHRSMDSAEELVALGDISHFEGSTPKHYCKDQGFLWSQSKPIVHESPKALVEYSLSIEGTHLLCFENDEWQEIPLTANGNSRKPNHAA